MDSQKVQFVILTPSLVILSEAKFKRRRYDILKINGQDFKLDVAPETPLLWVIREHLQLTGD
jgi:hypothetical protein